MMASELQNDTAGRLNELIFFFDNNKLKLVSFKNEIKNTLNNQYKLCQLFFFNIDVINNG